MRGLKQPSPFNWMDIGFRFVVLCIVTTVAGCLMLRYIPISIEMFAIVAGINMIINLLVGEIVTFHRKLDYLIQQNSSKE